MQIDCGFGFHHGLESSFWSREGFGDCYRYREFTARFVEPPPTTQRWPSGLERQPVFEVGQVKNVKWMSSIRVCRISLWLDSSADFRNLFHFLGLHFVSNILFSYWVLRNIMPWFVYLFFLGQIDSSWSLVECVTLFVVVYAILMQRQFCPMSRL